MTEEKKMPEEDEVTDEQLEDVAGSFLERFPNVPLEEVIPPKTPQDRTRKVTETDTKEDGIGT